MMRSLTTDAEKNEEIDRDALGQLGVTQEHTPVPFLL